MTREVHAYTDGASTGAVGPGGWGLVMRVDDGEWVEFSRGTPRTTNQRMEMIAALAALEHAPAGSSVTIYSDSAYLVNGMRQRWFDKWETNGWRNAAKKPVANRDVWERLITLCSRHVEVFWVKVKGHQISEGPHREMNARADELAVAVKKAAIVELAQAGGKDG